jgi:hypothetical protein
MSKVQDIRVLLKRPGKMENRVMVGQFTHLLSGLYNKNQEIGQMILKN